MIIKNGEILAIDHIAHDNTLSGNGTSAKPVGLSQSTKDLIDSKVKKTDFETYKSSAANQISNINTKITTDESNFNSYKSSAHDEIARVDASIAAVNAAKVDNTTFGQYQTDVANSFTAVNKRIDDVDAAKVNNTTFTQYQTDVANSFTAVNKRITDVDAAKQDKGEYVSASNFNSYKSSAHDEIARVDGRIDTTNTNLENNYYKKNQTYSQSEIDKKFADFGGYKFRAADPENNNQPILNDGEEPDPKVIYLTQPEGATQYLQWIWDEEITEENKWKCIGDTTMDLKDYAKTVDVVASAEANKDWAERTFETQTEFSAVIKGYYTKGEVDTELATKVSNADFNAYKTEVNGKFTNTSAWANEKFATKQNLTDTKAELEDTIESVSGILDGEIEAIATTLSNDYYTSLEIDAILAASGEYYTKTESDTKYAEKSVFETAINELSSNKLDKSATANWDVTEYTEGDNIKIVGHEISGKDWSNEIAAAVENKVDESEFNELYEKVGLIDNDLDTLSGKTVTVIKDSETVKAIPSTEPDGTISYTLSAHDGKQADYLWKPTVNAAGDISWELALTGDTPATANIKGSAGDNGKTPELTSENYHIKWKYTDESIWNDLGDFRGASGADGISPHIGENNHWFIGDVDTNIPATGPQGVDGVSPTVVTGDAVTSEEHKNGGITITVTDKTGAQTFTAWNGNDGTMAGAPGITGYDGITARNTGTTYEIGLSSDYKAAIQSVSSKLDESDFTIYTTTTAPAAFQPKGDYVSANEITDMATKTWVGQQKYLTEVATSGSIIGTGLSTNKIGLVTSAENALTAVANKANTADVYSKTDADDKFVTSSDVTTQDTDYVMTTTGWKVLSLPGGGMTQVIHDETLTGQGNDNNSKLGVAWSALSGYTITSALSANSATVAANLGTSSFADITGAINAKADATAISDMLTKTVASQTYLDKTTYATDSATYVTSGNEISAANEQYVLTTTGWSKIDIPATFTGVTTTGSISGGGVNNDTIGLLTSAENALTDVANKVAKPDTTQTELNNNYLIYSTLTGTGTTTGWMPLSANYYSKSEADGRYQKKSDMSSYLTTAQYETDSATFVKTADVLTAASNKLTGIKIGTTNYTVPDDYAKPNGNYQNLSAGSATSAYSAYSASYATTAASAYIDEHTTSAMSNIVNELHGKSSVTISNDQVVTTNNNGTTASVSAAQYVYNDSFNTAPKQLFVCQDDNDLTGHLSICNGKGTLFFVCSAISV